MQLRRDFLETYGKRIYGERQFLVLGVVLADPIEAVTPPDTEHVATRTLRWQDLAEFEGHPAHNELADYVAWKAGAFGAVTAAVHPGAEQVSDAVRLRVVNVVDRGLRLR